MMNNFLLGVLTSSSIILIFLISKVLIEIKMFSKTLRSSTSPRERRVLKALNTIEENLFDGGGKQRNILEDQKFQDELMKDFIKKSINEIIENSKYFDQDYIPQSDDTPYGHMHNVVRDNQGAGKDWKNWNTDRKIK